MDARFTSSRTRGMESTDGAAETREITTACTDVTLSLGMPWP